MRGAGTEATERGRDLAVLTLEVVDGSGAIRTSSSVLCATDGRAKPIEHCQPCVDSRGVVSSPSGGERLVACVRKGATAAAGASEPGRAEATLADRTWASAVMTGSVLALRPDVPLERARQLFLERGIGGAPVVDAEGRPVGFLSRGDLLRAGKDALQAGRLVADVMSRRVLSVADTAPVSEVAALLCFEGGHRAVVLGGEGRVVGVVTALDVLRWLTGQDGALLPSGTSLQGRG